MISPSRMAQVPFILYGIKTVYKAQLAISDSPARARRVTKCQVRNVPQFWKSGVILPLTRIQEKNLVGRVYMHRNRYYVDPLSLSFLEPQKNDVQDHHYFAQNHGETSQSKFKPTLHSLFTFGWTQWGSSYLCVVDNHTCTIMSSCPFVSPPTHLRRECSPTIFGSITTLYLISRILGNPS